jgi:hypothetical protein
VRLALAVCVLLLLAPAAALADYPVISYVDESGVFRLYEAEFAKEVDPPPPVQANFPGFRYAISLNGRYIVQRCRQEAAPARQGDERAAPAPGNRRLRQPRQSQRQQWRPDRVRQRRRRARRRL